MRRAGCAQVLIGFESPTAGALAGVETRKNFKQAQFARYQEAIRRIQAHGITVNACFILGLDGDTPEVFGDVLQFVRESGLYEVQITFLTAFPGTPLYARLKAEGRVLRENNWSEPGMVAADNLPPHKAALLLSLALLRTSEPDAVQTLFDTY